MAPATFGLDINATKVGGVRLGVNLVPSYIDSYSRFKCVLCWMQCG